MRIKAFKALRPTPDVAHQVASVPYDTVNTDEARTLSENNPKSFLRIVRPEINLPSTADLSSQDIFAVAKEKFREFQEKGFLVRETEPSIYVYRLKKSDHEQYGIVMCCHIEDYENNVIRRHEKTREKPRLERARHVETLNANTGPIFMTHKANPHVNQLVLEIVSSPPMYDFTSADNIQHTIWRTANCTKLVDAFDSIPVCYIADGHHRSAAAFDTGVQKRTANPRHTGEEEYNWFLSILFSADQLQVLPYNRCVQDLNGMEPEEFMEAIKSSFGIQETAQPEPARPGTICMYLKKKWYELTCPTNKDNDPVSCLDVSVLQEHLLSPVLGIQDPRTDKRIEFVGGIRGTDELKKRVDQGMAAVAFSMYPVSVDQIMAISDAGKIMPPKSTWFEPKPRSGLLIHTL
ncbi:DUF1015 domain-containing protein [Verrucomicrobiota bacterium]